METVAERSKCGFVDNEDDDGGLDMDCIEYICQIPKFVQNEKFYLCDVIK